MAWVSPTGYNDPDSKWSNEASAYDDDTGTAATQTASSAGYYLELTLGSAISCDKVQISAFTGYYSPPYQRDPDIDIDVFYSGAWHNIWSGTIANNTWVEKSIGSTESVDKARVKWNDGGDAGGRLEEFDFNEVEGGGQTLYPSGIASAEAFGTAQLNLKLEPTAIASAEAFGNAVVSGGGQTLEPSGIASGEAFGTPGVLTRFEYLVTGDYISKGIYGDYWEAQTFTPSAKHKVTGLRLKLFRIGSSPGTVTVSIKATDGSGHPAGGDLCSGMINGNDLTTDTDGAWYWIGLGDGYTLSQSTKYAIVIRAPSGDGSNHANWRCDDSGEYADGNRESSDDGGSNWYTISGADFMFEEWGQPVPTISPTGIASAEDFGDLEVSTGPVNLSPSGISSEEAFGAAELGFRIRVAGIASLQAFGTVILAGPITALGIPGAESFGTPRIKGAFAHIILEYRLP